MLLGKLLLRRRYSPLDYLAAALLCAGLVGFTLADSAGKASNGKGSSPLGIGLLLFAVSCDAVQVLFAEKMLHAHPYMTPQHVNLYTNSFAFVGAACAPCPPASHLPLRLSPPARQSCFARSSPAAS